MLPNWKLCNESCKLCVYLFVSTRLLLALGRKKNLLDWADWSWRVLNFSKLRFSFSTHLCVERSFSSCTSRTLPIARLEWDLCFGDLCTLKESFRIAKKMFSYPSKKAHGLWSTHFEAEELGCLQQRQLCESAFCWSWEMLYTLPGTGGVPLPSLLVGLDIYILTFWLNTPKAYILMQFCELV